MQDTHPNDFLMEDIDCSSFENLIFLIQTKYPVLELAFPKFIKNRLIPSQNHIIELPEHTMIADLYPLLSLTSPHFMYLKSLLPIYNSRIDGIGFQNLADSVGGYTGPILIIFRLADSSVIGSFVGG